jgi:spore germination protein YaaH
VRKLCSFFLVVCSGCGGVTPDAAPKKKLPPFVSNANDVPPSSMEPFTQPADPPPPAPSMSPSVEPSPQPSSEPSTQPSTSPSPSAQPTPSPSTQPSPAPTHTRCGWIDDEIAEQSFVANAAWFQAVHPMWYQLDSSGKVVTAGNPDLPSVVNAARANGVKLMPMIYNPDAARLRLVFANSSTIAAHVQTLVNLAKTHGYDGMDIDYEHLWESSDRAPMSALAVALAQAFHAAGLEISFALEPIGHDSPNGYDYQVLSNAFDVLHFMDYDYHYPDGDHMGPIAPLGWVEAAFQRAQATGNAGKFMLGLPNYAIGLGWYDWLKNGQALCVASAVETTTHMATCPYNEWNYSAGLSPHCLTASQGTIWYEDLASMEEKIQTAKKYGARGVTYWTIGNEVDGFFALVKKYFP